MIRMIRMIRMIITSRPVERTCLESLFLSFDFCRLSNNLPSNKRWSNLNSIHTNTCTEVYC